MLKVLLRPLALEDAHTSYKWRNDPEIWKYTGSKPNIFVTEQMEMEWLKEKINEVNSRRFAIIADNQYIGNIYISDIIEKKEGQYHIFIGEKNFWGKGIAKQSTDQLIIFAKENLKLNNLYLIVNPANIVAIKLYEKCGFVKVNDEIRMNLKLSNNKPPFLNVFVVTYNSKGIFINKRTKHTQK